MNILKLVLRTLRHYSRSSLASSAGVAVSTAVLCGALIIGDSLDYSLSEIVRLRLGNITHTITAGERLFTGDLARSLNSSDHFAASSVLRSRAVVSLPGGVNRVSNVNIWGIDDDFGRVFGIDTIRYIQAGEAHINRHLAARLDTGPGEHIQLRINKTSTLPVNTPLVSDAGRIVSVRLRVAEIVDDSQGGRLGMQATQSPPYNIFVDIDWLNSIMDLEDMANMLLIRDENELEADRIGQKIRNAWKPEDAGLKISSLGENRGWEITSKRVFIDDHLVDAVSDAFPDSEKYLTYFFNSISTSGKKTPYSFVASMPGGEFSIGNDEVIVNEWLASDLDVFAGDTVLMSYFETGPLRELYEREAWFVVKDIITMDMAGDYSFLMPYLPGLSDAGSCSDWDAGIPIDLDLIRDKDEDYWDEFRGTPKAFISLERGIELWQNRFGSLTTMVIPDNTTIEDIRMKIQAQADPFRIDFRVNSVREEGRAAARGGTDFASLFAGLGVFLIISGLLITALLFDYSIRKRKPQICIFAAMGYPSRLIRRIFTWEAFAVILAGTITGVLLSVGYSRLILEGLNHLWYDIVRTDVLILHISLKSIVIGALSAIIISLVVVYRGIGRATKEKTRHSKSVSGLSGKHMIIMPLFTLILFVLLLFLPDSLLPVSGMISYFAAGVLLLISLLSFYYIFLNKPRLPGGKMITYMKLSWYNLCRNPHRSFAVVVLLSLGTFVVVVTGANRRDLETDPANRSGGTGGFDFIAETTAPVSRDLNDQKNRREYGITAEVDFVQFFSNYDDDASCLNLNRVANPRIIATGTANLSGRFSFAGLHPLLDQDNPWKSLDDSPKDGIIPAVADMEVIRWGLGKSIGDTLWYTNSKGEEIGLFLAGGLENSVLQGNVIISAKHFLENFPDAGGSGLFLIESRNARPEETEDELSFIFRDRGWEMETTTARLSRFIVVENTYLRIFFMMGAFGMLLGTAGFAIIIAKGVLERKSEMALMSALGFPDKKLLVITYSENTILLLSGVLTGAISAIVSTLPALLEGSQQIPFGYLLLLTGVLILNGLVWILAIPYFLIARKKLAAALRNE